MSSQCFMQIMPKTRGTLGSSVGHCLLWHTMQTDNSQHVQLCQMVSSASSLHRCEMSKLHQTIYYYQNKIISWLSPWQTNYEIHVNLFLFQLWDFQGLQQSCRSLMLYFYSLTDVTRTSKRLRKVSSKDYQLEKCQIQADQQSQALYKLTISSIRLKS